MSTSVKNVLTAAVVALFVSFLVFAVSKTDTPAAQAPAPQVGSVQAMGSITGTAIESPYLFKAGHGDGGNHLTITADGKINAGQNTATWRNTTGRTVYVDLAEMTTTGTASTSYSFFVGTSSASTITDNFTDPFASLVDNFTLATSTTVRAVNSVKDAGTNGRGVIPVLSSEYVFFTFQQTYSNACTGATCETATSTNRGFNVDWYLRGHYKP